MTNILKNQITILALFVLFPIFTNAAISSNTNPIDGKKMIIEHKKKSFKLEKRTFQVNDEIIYKLVNDKIIQVGTITGFEADKVLIKNEDGMDMSIPLSGLEEIQKPSKLTKRMERLKSSVIISGLGLVTSLIVTTLAETEPSYGNHLINVPSISSQAILGLLGFLIFLPLFSILSLIYLISKTDISNPKFSKKNGWKMKIE